MRNVILRLLAENPGCNVWVTHLLEERLGANGQLSGDLLVKVGCNEFLLTKEKYLKYEKWHGQPGNPRLELNVVFTPKERTCFIISEKVSAGDPNPWSVTLTQRPCPPTQMVFSEDDSSDLTFNLI